MKTYNIQFNSNLVAGSTTLGAGGVNIDFKTSFNYLIRSIQINLFVLDNTAPIAFRTLTGYISVGSNGSFSGNLGTNSGTLAGYADASDQGLLLPPVMPDQLYFNPGIIVSPVNGLNNLSFTPNVVFTAIGATGGTAFGWAAVTIDFDFMGAFAAD